MKLDQSLTYIRNYYGVPAEIVRRVTIDGKPGVIVKGINAYIGVVMDCDKPTEIFPYHPTNLVEYGEMGSVRRMTPSQQRYRDYLEVADCFDNFRGYLLWTTRRQRALDV